MFTSLEMKSAFSLKKGACAMSHDFYPISTEMTGGTTTYKWIEKWAFVSSQFSQGSMEDHWFRGLDYCIHDYAKALSKKPGANGSPVSYLEEAARCLNIGQAADCVFPWTETKDKALRIFQNLRVFCDLMKNGVKTQLEGVGTWPSRAVTGNSEQLPIHQLLSRAAYSAHCFHPVRSAEENWELAMGIMTGIAQRHYADLAKTAGEFTYANPTRFDGELAPDEARRRIIAALAADESFRCVVCPEVTFRQVYRFQTFYKRLESGQPMN